MSPPPLKGYLCVMAAALLWATSGTVGKALFNAGMSPFILVQTRVTLAALILFTTLALARPALLRIKAPDLGPFLLFGGVFMALMQLSYFLAISKIQVAAAILVQYLAPVIVAGFSIAFWHERLTSRKVIALFLSMGGCYLVVGGYNLELLEMNKVGISWALLSALTFASTTLLGEKVMHRHNPWTTLAYGFLFAALALNAVYSPFSVLSRSYTPHQWASILYIVIFGTLLPFGLYFAGVNSIRSTRTIITATLEPISASFMAFFALGEVLSPLQIAGGISVIAAIVVLQREREHDPLSPQLIRAQKKG
ncbi:MAG: DMT family transporter [Deltaproteobacteria bacterium]|nr:DMT family transporter [Deltaproteobacteria bacterium]